MRTFTIASLVSLAVLAGCNMNGGDKPTQNAKEPAPIAQEPAAKTAAPAAPAKDGPLLLGERITEKDVALSAIAKDPKTYADKTIATSGTVVAVCQEMGCWMELKDETSQAHVKLAGHKFFVPVTAKGKHARVQAKVVKGDPEEDCKKEAEKQMGAPVAKLELLATGVELN